MKVQEFSFSRSLLRIPFDPSLLRASSGNPELPLGFRCPSGDGPGRGAGGGVGEEEGGGAEELGAAGFHRRDYDSRC